MPILGKKISIQFKYTKLEVNYKGDNWSVSGPLRQ